MMLRLPTLTLLLGWLLCAAGCSERNDVSVKLQSRPAPDEPLTRLEIQAQVAGPLTGLRYKWFAVSGECEPQEAESSKTVFTFPEGVKQDRVSVEVWRGAQRVAQGELKVKYDEERARIEQEQVPELRIEVTTIPPAETGGPDTRADIAGRIIGKVSPDYRVAVYTRAYGNWHIQPFAHELHTIRPDNTWTSWTHTGSSYGVLVVRKGYNPLVRLDLLPEVGGYVLSRTIVDGVTK